MFLSLKSTRTSVRSDAGAPSFGCCWRNSVAGWTSDQAASSSVPSILIGSVVRMMWTRRGALLSCDSEVGDGEGVAGGLILVEGCCAWAATEKRVMLSAN